MRLAFAGTPPFAQLAWARLHGAGFSIPLVLTQPDRPAGRAGWVSTSGIEKPAPCSRAHASCAKGGVPAKASLMRRCSYPLLVAGLLEHLGLDAVALERAQVFDEHLA